jgi:hypothetical protein
LVIILDTLLGSTEYIVKVIVKNFTRDQVVSSTQHRISSNTFIWQAPHPETKQEQASPSTMATITTPLTKLFGIQHPILLVSDPVCPPVSHHPTL